MKYNQVRIGDGVIVKEKNIVIHSLGTLDWDIYNCISSNHIADEVIITEEQMMHIRERHPEAYIDTLHYVVVGIALPIYSGVFYQFEVLAQLGVVYVRSTAQIGEITLTVKGDVLTLAGVLIDELHLVDLAFLFHQGAGLLRGQLKPFQG